MGRSKKRKRVILGIAVICGMWGASAYITFLIPHVATEQGHRFMLAAAICVTLAWLCAFHTHGAADHSNSDRELDDYGDVMYWIGEKDGRESQQSPAPQTMPSRIAWPRFGLATTCVVAALALGAYLATRAEPETRAPVAHPPKPVIPAGPARAETGERTHREARSPTRDPHRPAKRAPAATAEADTDGHDARGDDVRADGRSAPTAADDREATATTRARGEHVPRQRCSVTVDLRRAEGRVGRVLCL